MNAHLMPSLARTIDFLREAARAPASDWPSYPRALRELPHVGVEGGTAAMVIAAHSRTLVKQLPEMQGDAEGPARRLMLALADVLQCQFDARYEPPYYARPEA